MENKKIIEGIEPFNDVFYKNCFYNSLFPIINYYERNILSFLANDVLIYDNNGGENINFQSKFISISSFESLCDSESIIKIEEKKNNDNLINELIELINNNIPSIVFIDCFYEKIRPEMYMKKHWFHTVTIFGYDIQNKTFNIIEHRHKDNLGYEKRIIGFDELKNCNDGYINHFIEENGEVIEYSLSLHADLNANYHFCDNEEISKIFIGNIRKKMKDIVEGVNKLECFSKEFKKVLEDEELLKKNVNEIVNIINNTINCKRVERYKWEKILPQKYEMINLMDMIIEEWVNIRGIIGKFMFSEVYRIRDIKKAIEYMEEIVDLEKFYISKFRDESRIQEG